ncbi:hypothetical protein MUO14_00570 [Halobacillus shinanisalinarum]|uniref:Lipoprotein n=1 Tax=Halobacillus shinanisalinarum TaxID=2932258 RepID=A0ABY4GZB5_9BACI|nr:hypothetical protein [Halobacillus shinanisalinarum]UOQ93536.1 hypothetical protein MUO14_00570 [Halobacillus shinanisalinarum]
MKKWLLAIGLTTVLALAGCGSSSTEGESKANGEEKSSQEKGSDEKAVKKEILNAQMNMANTFRPNHSKIAAYQTAVGEEEPDMEAIKTAGEEAKTAAKKASEQATNYEIKADLPEEITTKYEEALPSLQSYYKEVGKALEADLENADFSTANEKFKEFQSIMDTVYEDAGLLTTDLMKEFS